MEVFIKVSIQSVLVMNFEEDENRRRFENRWPGAKIPIKSSFMEIDSVFCAFNKSGAPGKNSSVRSKLPTLACWSGRKVGKVRSKPALRE